MRAEGVERIALVSDEPELYSPGDLPTGTTINHRRDLDAVQRELRDIPGVTILIYAQTCATEKRRRRKRGTLEDPKKFAVINDLVCEGCGDCSVESNCLSVVPKETPLGRKREIDQNTCNKDFSCVSGFCPSFVTVENADRVRPGGSKDRPFPDSEIRNLPHPETGEIDGSYDLLVTGVGGTGVITVGALITMAAHLEGKGASVLDFMGFAQKFGPVLSYIRIARSPGELNQVRIDDGQADALIGCDLVVSSSAKASRTYRRDRTRAVLNTTEMSTADFVRNPDANMKADSRVDEIGNAVGPNNLSTLAANKLAEIWLGDTIYANVVMLGFAWQQGLLPVSLAAIERAIELNGVKVPENVRAFGLGRLAALDPAAIRVVDAPQDESLDDAIARREAYLVDYQDAALAARYRQLVDRVRAAESAFDRTGKLPVTDAVVRAWFKTLAYKDEYEVARLHANTDFVDGVRQSFGPSAKLKFHLAPPLLPANLDARGRPRKREFGAWILPVFRILAGLKGLRGTRLDIFGYTAERRMERALIGEFEATVERVLGDLSEDTQADAASIIDMYMKIRGFGPVKEEASLRVREQIETALADYGHVTARAA